MRGVPMRASSGNAFSIAVSRRSLRRRLEEGHSAQGRAREARHVGAAAGRSRRGVGRVRADHRSDAGDRREHIGATADLLAVAAEIAEQVRVLDGLVRYRFGDNAELMGAWASARNVLGPFKPKSEPNAGGGGSQTPKAA